MIKYAVVLSFLKNSSMKLKLDFSNMDDAREMADRICKAADECVNPSYSVAIESEDDADVLD